jgi:hypothetical protein
MAGKFRRGEQAGRAGANDQYVVSHYKNFLGCEQTGIA